LLVLNLSQALNDTWLVVSALYASVVVDDVVVVAVLVVVVVVVGVGGLAVGGWVCCRGWVGGGGLWVGSLGITGFYVLGLWDLDVGESC
jgi:hypothetical protein